MKFLIFSIAVFFINIAVAVESHYVAAPAKVKKQTSAAYKFPQSRASKRFQKQLAQVQNPSYINDEDEDGYEDIDIYVSYRRPEVADNNNNQVDDELSPYVAVRLALARAKAMHRYREIWG